MSAILAACLLIVAAADPPAGSLPVSGRWHDADTLVDARVDLPYGLSLVERRGVRAIGYDAWEIGSRGGANVTPSERAKGQAALYAIRELTANRPLRIVPPAGDGRDSFGRLLGQLWVSLPNGEWVELSRWANDNGHVRTVTR